MSLHFVDEGSMVEYVLILLGHNRTKVNKIRDTSIKNIIFNKMREKRSPLFGFVGNLMYFCKLLCPQVSVDWKIRIKRQKI